jgi:hypothetical protein
MIKFGFLRAQTDLDVAQTFAKTSYSAAPA